MSIDGKVGTEGQGHSGCLATKSFHISSLLGANPGDTSTWHKIIIIALSNSLLIITAIYCDVTQPDPVYERSGEVHVIHRLL